MNSNTTQLKDDGARRAAIELHERSILVEAGAGSGKTAVMAGRIALMLAKGIPPRSIAAVTFTELAASELLSRVREFVTELSNGKIAKELLVAMPDGLSPTYLDNLAQASAAIDEITCSTIHGFCQRLIKPYPAEADIDPGAVVMDRDQADLTFLEIVDEWLRESLSGERDGILAEMVLHDPSATLDLIHNIAENLRRRPSLAAPPASSINDKLVEFDNAASAFSAFVKNATADEPETRKIVGKLCEMAATAKKGSNPDTPAGLIHLLTSRPHKDICTKAGEFKAYQKQGKWVTAARNAGLSMADGRQLNDEAKKHYEASRDAWYALLEAAAGQTLLAVINNVRPILNRYREIKRASARLDFDDLIFAARDLLSKHDEVRKALGKRFPYVLVDEFQDTDPLQTEIFWRLCGDPIDDENDWTKFRIRPGALFLVGDPKQAIYRFRGADVGTYLQARDAFRAQNPDSLLSISTNFRSYESILCYVNQRFEPPLSADNQPGFTALDPFHMDDGRPTVVALDIEVADINGEASAELQRDAEADAIAELCAKLILHRSIIDRKSGAKRPCQPGDIALLAPTGAELWRYEEALERKGIPVATQAGKGLYRRQEIQDLIALTRVLADRHDTLALGALLRGPLVGLTEEEILDIIWSLPRSDDQPDRIPRLNLSIETSLIAHPLARDIIERLQSLSRQANSTTPHELLSQAVDVMRVRPLLLARHSGQAERALANVDLYLSLSTSYAVRGLRAFAKAMSEAWSDESRAIEGRPDAQEESVALFTMHAAKGLEWPIVVPINTMTVTKAPERSVIDRQNGIFYCPIFKVSPEGYEEARQVERKETERERIRLWYVTTTRARELLVLPRLDTQPANSAWVAMVDLALDQLPSFEISATSTESMAMLGLTENTQTRESFIDEAKTIAKAQTQLTWRAPSRDEGSTDFVLVEEEGEIWTELGNNKHPNLEPTLVRGGRERGLILHKLMEEVLSGIVSEGKSALIERSSELIRDLGRSAVDDPAAGLSPRELAECVIRTLALDEVIALRPNLQPEVTVYSAQSKNGMETVTTGIADALSLNDAGRPTVVVDWKSDVSPEPETLRHYRAQVQDYLNMTGADRGLVVLMTSGIVINVTPHELIGFEHA